ncbi:MAG TPA: hypothetical protein VGR81_00510 [Candidatus Acidoferrales bacterium]|nr:hypothetical protein [Candidatus Acidoferrales bacterium]
MPFETIWRKIAAGLRSRAARRPRVSYVRALEDEVARLRAENRALVNSILGVAGIPPIRSASVAARINTGHDENNIHGFVATAVRPAAANSDGNSHAAPLRRRSWHQIGRALEIEDLRAAQRERESNTETFPAPRNVVPRA